MAEDNTSISVGAIARRLPFGGKTNGEAKTAIALKLYSKSAFEEARGRFSKLESNWISANGFAANPSQMLRLPNDKGEINCVLSGHDNEASPLALGELSKRLESGLYKLDELELDKLELALLGLALGAYNFGRYKKASGKEGPRFLVPDGAQKDRAERAASATYLVRDLINTPTNDMGPDDLESVVHRLARAYKARVEVIHGEDLLEKNFPMVHAVGRASDKAPRLIDMRWGKKSDPRITLVGKGVCFDTGGLNIKPGSSMALMKKDMGGAAHVIGLAMMIMDARLPVQLRLLIPAVENAISGNAFRPGDILSSRKGISVEIGNTDAEGRLILGDALTYGDEEEPDLMIDMATLTGAARVALGPDLPPFYTDDEALARTLAIASQSQFDPLWHMPLWAPYEKMLASKIADCNHISTGGFAGSITAALFLRKFVNSKTPWIHLDVYGWNPTVKPWAPIGGEAQGIRALFSMIEERYC